MWLHYSGAASPYSVFHFKFASEAAAEARPRDQGIASKQVAENKQMHNNLTKCVDKHSTNTFP